MMCAIGYTPCQRCLPVRTCHAGGGTTLTGCARLQWDIHHAKRCLPMRMYNANDGTNDTLHACQNELLLESLPSCRCLPVAVLFLT
jgi:hypothetical protein